MCVSAQPSAAVPFPPFRHCSRWPLVFVNPLLGIRSVSYSCVYSAVWVLRELNDSLHECRAVTTIGVNPFSKRDDETLRLTFL